MDTLLYTLFEIIKNFLYLFLYALPTNVRFDYCLFGWIITSWLVIPFKTLGFYLDFTLGLMLFALKSRWSKRLISRRDAWFNKLQGVQINLQNTFQHL